MVRHGLSGLRTLASLLLAVAPGAGPARSVHHAPPRLPSEPVRSGDLVFRVGVGWRAAAVRLLSRAALSHVGVAVVTRAGVDVVHASPPEGDDPGGVVEGPLAAFAAPYRAAGIAIYRRVDVDAAGARRIAAAARAFAAARTPFDDRFDLTDARAMYCTELVLRASAAAGAPLPAPTTRLGGVLSGRYVLPRDLVASERLRPLAMPGLSGWHKAVEARRWAATPAFDTLATVLLAGAAA